jgi:hypothetical protein
MRLRQPADVAAVLSSLELIKRRWARKELLAMVEAPALDVEDREKGFARRRSIDARSPGA